MDIVLESATSIVLSDNNLEHLKETYDEYLEYLYKLSTLDSRILTSFLSTLKDREIINNQETENEDIFLMEFYRIHQAIDSISVAMESFKDDYIDKDELKYLHGIVIKGSSDDIPENYDFRSDDNKWVGSFNIDGTKNIDYMPPSHTQISSLLDKTLAILNDKIGDEVLDNPLIKPFIVHALIAYIQPFGNGNTRLSRLVQHGKIWTMSNKESGIVMPMPTLYLSKNYRQTRGQYRDLIRYLATTRDWNSWFNYNLNMIDEQLFFCSNNLQKIRR